MIEKSIKVKLVPDPKVEIPYPRIYSNNVSIQSTPFDITMRFCDAIPIFEKLEGKGEIFENHIPILAEIVLPVAIIPSLIQAIKKQYENYMSAYGEPIKDEKKK